MQAQDRRTPIAELMVLMAGVLLGIGSPALAQLPPAEEERLQILSDPEALKKKAEKDKNRPPFEFFRSRVTPFDVIPYVKANHWSTVQFELRANDDDYDGFLQTDPVRMMVGAQQVSYRRAAQLLKEKRASLGIQIMVPSLSGAGPQGTLGGDDSPGCLAARRQLAGHDDHPADSPDAGAGVKQRGNAQVRSLESHVRDHSLGRRPRRRRHRETALLSAGLAHGPRQTGPFVAPAHMVDDQPYDLGRLHSRRSVVIAATGPSRLDPLGRATDHFGWGRAVVLAAAREFLGPYLPADATAETVPLTQDDLRPLSQSYPPPNNPANPNDQSQPVPATREEAIRRFAYRYQAPVPIRPAPTRPLYVAVLKPRPGASTIPLGEASPHLLAVEQRVGRGRITMLTINPNEESLLAWPGLDTLVRRVVLRRPEEPIVASGDMDVARSGIAPKRPHARRRLSWYRIMSRDAIGGAAPAGRRTGDSGTARIAPHGPPTTTPTPPKPRSTARPAWPNGAIGASFPNSPTTCSTRRRGSRSPARISSCE